MKKTLFKIFCLLLSFVLLMSVLAACNDDAGQSDPPDDPSPTPPTERELALALYRSVDEKMSAVNSYAVKVDIELATAKDGIHIMATGTENEYFVNLQSSTQFSHLSHGNIEMNMTYNGQTQKLENETRSGYVDGKMFLSNKETQNGTVTVDQKLYSSISCVNYLAYYDEIYEDVFELSDSDFSVATYKQNENGTITASFSGFTAQALEKMPFFDEDLKDMFEKGKQPTDMVITLVVGADQYPLSLSIAFHFENGGISTLAATAMPELKISATYSGINATTVPAVDLADFSSVGDLRAIEYANRAIKDRLNAENGSFQTESAIAASIPGAADRSDIKQNVQFATTNGRYSYRVEQNVDGQEYVYIYENDVLRQEGGNSVAYTDEQARAEIISNMDPGDFTVSNVKSSKIVSKTDTQRVCEFTFLTSDDAVALAESYERHLKSFTSQITVTIEQGQLTKYVYNLTVVLAYGSGEMQITWIDTVTF